MEVIVFLLPTLRDASATKAPRKNTVGELDVAVTLHGKIGKKRSEFILLAYPSRRTPEFFPD